MYNNYMETYFLYVNVGILEEDQRSTQYECSSETSLDPYTCHSINGQHQCATPIHVDNDSCTQPFPGTQIVADGKKTVWIF